MAEKEKLTRKEKRLRWKEAKRARRQAEKDYYQYAPWFKRVWNLYLKKVFVAILVVAVLFSMVTSSIAMMMEADSTGLTACPSSTANLQKTASHCRQIWVKTTFPM